jgi:hypothetical protein
MNRGPVVPSPVPRTASPAPGLPPSGLAPEPGAGPSRDSPVAGSGGSPRGAPNPWARDDRIPRASANTRIPRRMRPGTASNTPENHGRRSGVPGPAARDDPRGPLNPVCIIGKTRKPRSNRLTPGGFSPGTQYRATERRPGSPSGGPASLRAGTGNRARTEPRRPESRPHLRGTVLRLDPLTSGSESPVVGRSGLRAARDRLDPRAPSRARSLRQNG